MAGFDDLDKTFKNVLTAALQMEHLEFIPVPASKPVYMSMENGFIGQSVKAQTGL